MEAVREEADTSRFRERFAAVGPLIRAEWPAVEPTLLEATKGELDAVVTLIAKHADRTRVATKRALLELLSEADRVIDVNGASGASSKGSASPDAIDDALAALRRFEAFAGDEAKRMKATIVPDAEAHVRKNVWSSLLIALGIGLVLGLWFNGGRGRG